MYNTRQSPLALHYGIVHVRSVAIGILCTVTPNLEVSVVTSASTFEITDPSLETALGEKYALRPSIVWHI